MNESHGSLELLSTRVDELEKRVRALEHPDEVKARLVNRDISAPSISPDLELNRLQAANIFPLVGRAMLGIAGAYVLRAVAEADLMPKVMVAIVAIVYGLMWLVWAGRSGKTTGIAPHVYAGTSAVILVPMLWEITLHFHVFAPVLTAGVLAAYMSLATVIGTREGCARFAWIAQGVGAITAVALAVATHDVLPFLVTLLLTGLVIEFGRSREYSQPAWPLIAVVTDGAIWGMIFIYSGPSNARTEYADLSAAALVFPACMLFAIYGASVAVGAILNQNKVGIFDAIQATAAFFLLISSVLIFLPQHERASLGILCIALAAGCYASIFLRLRGEGERRNFNIFAVWSAALLTAGTLWTLPPQGGGVSLAFAGSAAYVLAGTVGVRMLEPQGALFLCTAMLVSGAARYIFDTLAASLPGRPAVAVWAVACCAVAAYAAGKKAAHDGWAYQLLDLVPALLAVSTISALLVHGALKCAALASALGLHHIAFLRTLVISLVAMLLAYVGPRWRRAAVTRLAYVALAFIGVKLLFEDLRHGHMEFIAASIFLFAITLIAVPRFVRLGTRSGAVAHPETPVHIGD